MNILRALRPRDKARRDAASELRDKLPQVNGFVDLAIDGSRWRESVPINDITATELITRRRAAIRPGAAADFLYTNGSGRFRFSTVCASVDATAAYFDLPASIKTIESFENRRADARVPWVSPVQWRYAPGGHGYGEYLPATLIDLSRRGASLVVGRDLKAGAQVEIQLSLKRLSEPLIIVCHVVRATKSERSAKNRAGVAFLGVAREQEQLLADLVNGQQAVRRDRGVV